MSSSNTGGRGPTTFDPFKSHSYNVQSAAKGLANPNSIIPSNSNNTITSTKSATERQLELLQQKQKELEQAMHSKFIHRDIIAFLPPNTQTTSIVSLTSSTDIQINNNSNDSSLLLSQMKRMQNEQRQNETFQTKAMRDLKKYKQKKVYSHVQLRIHFPDGVRIDAKFLPNETMSAVKDVILSSFVTSLLLSSNDFDLYISPPRRLLDNGKTLDEEGLVPAAKIHVSWTNNGKEQTHKQPGCYIQQHLFDAASISNHSRGTSVSSSSLFPESKSINESNNSNDNSTSTLTKNDDNTTTKKSSKNAISREDELMMKMMGKKKLGVSTLGRSLGRGGSSSSGGDSSNNSGKGTGGKPKWFKG